MAGKQQKPWPGMALALLVAGCLSLTSVSPYLTLLVALVWIVSLWVEWLRPVPEEPAPPPPPRVDVEGLIRSAMCAALEPLGLPLVLMRSHRIIAANSAARAVFGAHIVGQDARIALRHPDAVRLLDLADGGSVTIRGLSGAGSLWQLTRERIDEHYWTIELLDRTAEADIGRAHTDFVANASHELRTPLAAIIGYVETLAEDPGRVDAETTARFLAIVLREARRMQSLVADLMSLSQLEAEKHDIPKERIDLCQLAARVAGEFAPMGDAPPRVVLDRCDTPLGVAGDVKQLEQLLRNLIDNALKYGDADKPVEVSVTSSAGSGRRAKAVMRVRDHGAGIAAEHLPHLTRRFYRTDPGRSRAAGGTGLGLAIVKHIVERHRGKLDITSQLGDGTLVCVSLPLVSLPVPENRALS